MASPFPRQLQLAPYHDSDGERTHGIAGSNGDTADPITVILVEESKSVASQQGIVGCIPEKKLDGGVKNRNVVSRVFHTTMPRNGHSRTPMTMENGRS
ncbi:hypothetical protein FAGAP_8459 [Fusarium agapanthi]|uniref:Uncharacterized protein n=1 Tax=Fusarium agapanthi TaxID=1803897 RepID=A0A9P5B5L7_9HYPO|nr:hypothetical protein FAGAP_8459 [Fusarium agapanthi]